MKHWIDDLFGVTKPIIAMCHLWPLPGDPYYNKNGGMTEIIEWARKDLQALQDGGVDAVMFSNEFSLPYLTKVHQVTAACMARVIGELMAEIRVPIGVNVLWDPYASLDLAAATGASFTREIFSGVYASDFGLWNPNCGDIVRHRRAIDAENVKLLFNIVPEAAQYLANRHTAFANRHKYDLTFDIEKGKRRKQKQSEQKNLGWATARKGESPNLLHLSSPKSLDLASAKRVSILKRRRYQVWAS